MCGVTSLQGRYHHPQDDLRCSSWLELMHDQQPNGFLIEISIRGTLRAWIPMENKQQLKTFCSHLLLEVSLDGYQKILLQTVNCTSNQHNYIRVLSTIILEHFVNMAATAKLPCLLFSSTQALQYFQYTECILLVVITHSSSKWLYQ